MELSDDVAIVKIGRNCSYSIIVNISGFLAASLW